MAFLKGDDEAERAAYFALSDGAYRLDDAARQWSARTGTDGLLPARRLHTLTPTRDRRTLVRKVAELEQAGLWIPLQTNDFLGWDIPAVLQWNWTAERKRAHQLEQARKGALGANAKWGRTAGGLALVPDPEPES